MINTESDPHPALLQIQAIHNEHQATVFLFEVQHLPPPSSTLFAHIQALSRTIFSPNSSRFISLIFPTLLKLLMLFSDTHADSAHCICPYSSRPYRSRSALWLLQKVIYLSFNRALHKPNTSNTWSCGLSFIRAQ